MGFANFFVQHTSASLTVNENASPDVPLDLADSLDRLAPEGNQQKYRHDDEGPDDMWVWAAAGGGCGVGCRVWRVLLQYVPLSAAAGRCSPGPHASALQ